MQLPQHSALTGIRVINTHDFITLTLTHNICHLVSECLVLQTACLRMYTLAAGRSIYAQHAVDKPAYFIIIKIVIALL